MIAGHLRASECVYLTGALVSVAGIAWELYRRQLAGPVLLDLGGKSRLEMLLGVGVVMLALAAICLLFAPRSRYQGLFYIGYGVITLLTATRRSQIRQSGIFARRFFRWQEIEEYYLSPGGALALKLRGTGWTRTGVSVPSDLWQQANAVLATRVPAQQGVIFAA